MREKLGVAGVVVLVAAVWVTGWLWQTGRVDLSTAAAPGTSQQLVEDGQVAGEGAGAAPSPSTSSATPPSSPSAAPSGTGASPRPGAAEQQVGAGAGRAAQQAQARADAVQRAREVASQPPTLDFRLATINVLGSTHTAGNAPRYARFASGSARVGGLLQVLRSRGIDVAGLQEFQPVQRAVFARRSSGWSTYPGGSSFDVGTTSMVWRTDRFELVEGRLTAMPFYGGETRMAPAVLLRDRETGVRFWAATVHNPADTGKFPRQQGARNLAAARQAALVRELGADDLPVLFTGDMNEKAAYFCRFTAATGFTSPGAGTGGCRPPAGSGIDWIFGSPGLQWTSFVVDRSSLVRRTTDHPVRVAGVRVDAADFTGSWTPPEVG